MPISALPEQAAAIAPDASLSERLLRSTRLSPTLALRLTQWGLLALFLTAAACHHG
ncbi:hypothetical protein [Curvibacter gracilis]|uniref:hypothetical protein n=1 Tax=Curvibacter gracilis TaxID=230310 RepID=UPI0004B23BA3|nr:hypothetical protein [Curvibacter gracilis]